MTKLQLLHRALNERMMAAVEQIMEMVGGTVQEYEEETLRVRKENEVLKRRLQWMEETHRTEWPGEPVSIQEESTQSQTETSAISFEFPQEAQPVEIKSESTDNALFVSPMTTIVTLPQSTDLGPVIAGTSDSFNYVQNERLTWKSIPSYMEPLEFDPTSSNMVRCDSIRGKRQRMSFACPDCGKVFGREQGLLFHMRTHSTERPYMYRKRKVFYYGDRRRKRKLQGLSRLSRERVDNVLDGSEQANTDSPSTEEQEQEPGHSSSKSDQTSNNTVTEENTSNPVIPKEGEAKKKRCPLCRQKFKRRIDFDIHLKSHMEAKQPVIYRREPKKVAVLTSRCFSKVWDYYSKESSGRVICNICSAIISQGSSNGAQKNTTNLWAHLSKKHTHQYLEAKGIIIPFNSQINPFCINKQGESKLKQEPKEEPCFGSSTLREIQREKTNQGEIEPKQFLNNETCSGSSINPQENIHQKESDLKQKFNEETCFGSIPQVAILSARCFSKVWDYYTKDLSDRVICNVCSAIVSQGSRSAARKNTTNLWAHLKVKHTNQYLEAKGFTIPVNSSQINTLYTNECEIKQEFKEESFFDSTLYINDQGEIQQGQSELLQESTEENSFVNL